jgi:uncharacterized coiled-coil protein SlyX
MTNGTKMKLKEMNVNDNSSSEPKGIKKGNSPKKALKKKGPKKTEEKEDEDLEDEEDLDDEDEDEDEDEEEEDEDEDEDDYEEDEPSSRRVRPDETPQSSGSGAGAAVAAAIIALVIGLVIGYFLFSGAETDTSDLEDKIDDLEDNVNAKDGTITQLNNNISALNLQIAEKNSNISDLLDEKIQLNADIDQLNQYIAENETAIAQLKEDLATAIHTVSSVEESTFPMAIHLNSKYLELDCTDCHEEIDGELVTEFTDYYQYEELDANHTFRKIVNIENCALCHSPFSTTDMEPNYIDMDCTASGCHDDWKVAMQDVTFVNQDNIFDSEDCLKCHGGQEWFVREH